MWGPAIVMVCIVWSSVCHTGISPKLSEIDVWLLETQIRIRASRFRICHQICDWKYGSTIFGVSGLLSPMNFTIKAALQCAPWWASYRHIP